MNHIPSNLESIKLNIFKAAQKRNIIQEDIILVCVTKQIPLDLIKKAIDAGVTVIGENRVEEAKSKKEKLPEDIKIHMIGHLQTRKVRDAVKIFDLIHSVDSLRLVERIQKCAYSIEKIQEILLEVNVSEEESKYGFTPEDLMINIRKISKLVNVKIMGLMTMAPFYDDPELTRPIFSGLKKLKNDIISEGITNVEMKYLSMGMSNDYMVAIEEGSNMVRVGTAVFFPSI